VNPGTTAAAITGTAELSTPTYPTSRDPGLSLITSSAEPRVNRAGLEVCRRIQQP